MKINIVELIQEIEEAEKGAKYLRDLLNQAQRNCSHEWGGVKYVPEHRAGYQDPGDPEGTMGIDRRLPCYIPSETIKRWERTCSICKLKQTTTSTRMVVASGRIEGTSGMVEEPLFL